MLFVDTSGWASLFVKQERDYELATKNMSKYLQAGLRVITLELVLIELYSLLTSPIKMDHQKRNRIIGKIRDSSWATIIPIDDKLLESAWELSRSRPDKNYSVVDCSSFIIMSQLGITQVLTADRHFVQAGFEK